jgi:hypothetical protein
MQLCLLALAPSAVASEARALETLLREGVIQRVLAGSSEWRRVSGELFGSSVTRPDQFAELGRQLGRRELAPVERRLARLGDQFARDPAIARLMVSRVEKAVERLTSFADDLFFDLARAHGDIPFLAAVPLDVRSAFLRWRDFDVQWERLPGSRDLIESFFDVSTIAARAGEYPSFLDPRLLPYLLGEMTAAEQGRLAAVLREAAGRRFAAPSMAMETALAEAGDDAILRRMMAIDRRVEALKDLHKKAVDMALTAHDGAGQLYGGRPYSTHLRNVREVLKRFGLGPRDSVLGLELGTIAWLHDVVEDTTITARMIAEAIGPETAEIVSALSNVRAVGGISKAEAKRLTFQAIARLPKARYAKLADRISNTEESLRGSFLGDPSSKIAKYRAEWPEFRSYLYDPSDPGPVQAMWRHLERLMADEAYARSILLE